MSQIQKISTGYTPRPFQEQLHAQLKRFNVLNLHRRFGKTILAINENIDRGLRCMLRNPQYVYVAPTYGQAKRVAWSYYKEFSKMLPGVEYKEGELKVVIPRPHLGDEIRIWLVGAENPDSIRGMYLDGAILDEYAAMSPIVWSQVIRPALSDRKGWAIFIGTPAGENHFYDLYIRAGSLDDWFCRTITVEESKVIDEEELASARGTMTEDEFMQEYMCSFTAALTGAYFSKFMQDASEDGRITEVPYDPSYPVATFWDLGISDSMAIWFVQKLPNEIFYRVIDYIEDHGKGIDFYIKQLQIKPYTYARHHLPHDANHRELSTGTTRVNTFERKGLKPIEVVPKVKIKADAIHAVREKLPLCKFDAKKCYTGIQALKNYQREYDHKNKKYKDRPKHDWTSHGSDAFQTFARGVNEQLSFVSFSELMDKMQDTAEGMDLDIYE